MLGEVCLTKNIRHSYLHTVILDKYSTLDQVIMISLLSKISTEY